MDELITRLTNLFNLSKTVAISIPGLVAAIACALLLWPPATRDWVMTSLDAPAVRAGTKTECTFMPEPLDPATVWTAAEIKRVAVKNQETLEHTRERVQACLTAEGSLVGTEEDQIRNLENEIKVAELDRNALQLQYEQYEKSRSGLRNEYRLKYLTADQTVKDLRSRITGLQTLSRGRKANIELETSYLKIVMDRLGDPGRLRPSKRLDDFLSGLVNHVVAFGLLALALGLLLDPLNRAVFGAFFDGGLVRFWNVVRPGRFTVWR